MASLVIKALIHCVSWAYLKLGKVSLAFLAAVLLCHWLSPS